MGERGVGVMWVELTDKSLRGTKCVHSTACEDCDFLRLLEVVTFFLSLSLSLSVRLSVCLSVCLPVCLLVCVCLCASVSLAFLCQIESIS